MFVILTYDIEAKRVGKVLKICRKYLDHAQKSVFDGHLTETELRRLKSELRRAVNPKRDSVRIYRLDSLKYASKDEIGLTAQAPRII